MLSFIPSYFLSARFHIFLATTIAISLFMSLVIHGIAFRETNLQVGSIAQRTVRAPSDVIIRMITDSGAEEFYEMKRGEVIVRTGDRIAKDQLQKLNSIRSQAESINPVKVWGGYFILSGLVVLTVFLFFNRAFVNFNPQPRDLILLSSMLCLSLFFLQVFNFLGVSLSHTLDNFDAETFLLATPLAVGGLVLQSVLGCAAVSVFVLTFSLLTGAFLESSWLVLTIIVIGNFVAASTVYGTSKRSAFLRASLRIGATNTILVLAFFLLSGDFDLEQRAYRVLCALIGGLGSGVIAIALIPVVEFFGKYTTDMKLLELSSLDLPLLRDLSLQAPGTWNHSVVVGQMSEVAAREINANALLARVGAYYHDIGKSKYPAYFIENQQGGENRHDKLTPSMSALIIRSHVKDGVELAEDNKLPEVLIDMIRQHHGTSLIEYFYDKAKKEAEEDDVVEESNFRYPGPKPQTKEAAILMLADAIEAAARTLSDPSPAKIQGHVQKLINKVFASGQLDESGLTLRDLHLIAKSFVRVLNGIHHRRVEYPDSPQKDKSKNKKEIEEKSPLDIVKNEKSESKLSDSNAGQKGTTEESSTENDSEDSRDTLRRLGQS